MTRQALRVFLSEWFCGCGSPEAACRRLLDILALCPLYDNREAFKRLVPDDGIEMLLLYTLDHFDLIEHGVGIGGSWLTDKGTQVREALRREEGDEFETLTQQSCCHGYAVESDELMQCPECGPMNRR